MALRGTLSLCIGRGILWLSPYDKMREIAIEQFSREYRLYRNATAPAVDAEWRLLPDQGSTPRTAITLPPPRPAPPSLPDYDYERDGPLFAGDLHG